MGEVNKVVEIAKNFNKQEWEEFSRLTRRYNRFWLEDYSNSITTQEDTLGLHELLVQTVIDYIKDRGLNDIEELHLSIDNLQSSVKYGKWVPATDSSLSLIGMEEEGKYLVRRLIKESY